MNDHTARIEQMLTEIELKRKTVNIELSESPKGRLIQTINNGRPVIVCVTGRGNSRKRRHITRDRQLQVRLARRGILEEELRMLELRLGVLEQARSKLAELKDPDMKRFAIERYGWLSSEEIEACCFPKPGHEWENEPYEKLAYRTGELKHITSRGLRVRSKSELLIAETLYRYDLPFRYEQVYRSGSISVSADFTIRRADSKVFIWEHEGLINRRSYIEWQRKKAELYASIGFYPWDNMIVTYDTEDGNIDLRIVESQILNKLII